jgi:hypothetical protein
MSDFVYKQMINKVDNTPIIGGTFFLRNVETLDEYTMYELPEDPSGSTQGRYVSDEQVPNGVYKIFRVVASVPTDTGDEVHVEPGRVNHGGDGVSPYYPVTSRVVGDVVHAVAFLDDDATTNDIGTLNEAMAWAALNGYAKVCAGTYKGDSSWSGSIQLQIPVGIKVLDLAGASVECTTLNLTPIVNSSIQLCVKDGSIQGNGTGGTPHVVSDYPIFFDNVKFIGFATATGFTTVNSGAIPTRNTIYINCNNVRFDGGMRHRTLTSYGTANQVAIGSADPTEYPIDTGNPAMPTSRANVAFADADASELTQLIREAQIALKADPSDAGTFNSMESFANAVKNMWFTYRPRFIESSVYSLRFREDIVKYAGTDIRHAMTLKTDADVVSRDSYNSGCATSAAVDNGFIIRRFFREGDTSYRYIEIDMYVYFPDGGHTVGGSWTVGDIRFPSSLISSYINDIDGVTSMLPTDSDLTPVDATGIVAAEDGTSSNNTAGLANIFGGIFYVKAGDPGYYHIEMGPYVYGSSDNRKYQAFWLEGNDNNSLGAYRIHVKWRWDNPKNTNYPRFK